MDIDWWTPEGFEQRESPIGEIEWDYEGIRSSGHFLVFDDQDTTYSSSTYLHLWQGRGYILVEVPLTQFCVALEDLPEFMTTTYQDLMRNVLAQQQIDETRKLREVLDGVLIVELTDNP